MKSIRIRGAEEHNLKNISLEIPHGKLTVLTGVSGSGKSSLAFDTIYKEGRRRFLESLSSYARRFLGGLEKPQVESIDGLSPAISIEQKTIGHSPRSTVGTITEIHDHFRLLYARLGLPHCPNCEKPVRSQSADQVVDQILHRFGDQRILICAPIIWGRRGEFRKEIQNLRRDGYQRLRVDGVVLHLGQDEKLNLDRRKTHDLEVVYDRQRATAASRSRIVEAVEKCFSLASGVVNIVIAEPPESADSKPADSKPADSKPADSKPEDSKPGDSESADSKTGSPKAGEHLFSGRFACPDCGFDLPELEPRLFSFNLQAGACSSCSGLGRTERVDPDLVVSDPSSPFAKGGLVVYSGSGRWLRDDIDKAAFLATGKRLGFSPASSWGDLSEASRSVLLHGDASYSGLVRDIEDALERKVDGLDGITRNMTCTSCDGARLSELARAVTFQKRRLPDLYRLPISDLLDTLGGIELEGLEASVGIPLLDEIKTRLRFLVEVGLGYLTLERSSQTLSGGEAQRIRLASQVGAGLQGVCYVLDEPSIGLHPRDNARLLGTLRKLTDLGNTVLVVEHDRETAEVADFIVDLGPGAGTMGGEIVAIGTRADIVAEPRSITGAYLSRRKNIPVPEARRQARPESIELYGANHNNLKNVDVSIPLGQFVVCTGVSGSGKSSLINQVLWPALLRKKRRRGPDPGRHRSLRGEQYIDKLIDIDQSPIGRSPRSNPATYSKLFGWIRELYARLPEARVRGYTAGRFSFNVDGGRCPECGGAGLTVVDMQFLAPVEVNCDECGGKRYNRETLEILYRGKSISEVLELTVNEGLEFFRDVPRLQRSLEVMQTVGLGYIQLGQASTTLSGGESQRLKLAAELLKKDTGNTLYILDEPTTGLHFEDIRVLLDALHKLVDRGNSVIVIEHQLDVIKTADYVIDLGPEGGEGGGEIVVQGSPEEVASCEASHTGRALRQELNAQAEPQIDPPREPNMHSNSPATRDLDVGDEQDLMIRGATLHNLEAVDVDIPRGSITVITGVSGSGKTSLAFDTIFAEGQRRYIESLSTYARQFLGRLQSPPVDSIRGLAPAIAIDQKAVHRSSRSTVATVTEIHDHLRLLFARIGTPHCPACSEPLRWTTASRLAGRLVEEEPLGKLHVLAPIDLPELNDETVRTILGQLLKEGFTRVRAGREYVRLDEDDASAPLRRVLHALNQSRAPVRPKGPKELKFPDPKTPIQLAGPDLLDDDAIESGGLYVVADRLILKDSVRTRLADSISQAFRRSSGVVAIALEDEPIAFYHNAPSCPRGHFTFDEQLAPRLFSFNSHDGACPRCRGTGIEGQIRPEDIFTRPERPPVEAVDPELLSSLKMYQASTHHVFRALIDHWQLSDDMPYGQLDERYRRELLFGCEETIPIPIGTGFHEARWRGLVTLFEEWARDTQGPFVQRLSHYLRDGVCRDCDGRRLQPRILGVKVGSLDIHATTQLSISAAREHFRSLQLDERNEKIARDVRREIDNRLHFLEDVGLGYLTLDRESWTLSGGEAQRIRLASQLGNQLVGVFYVLDEPTVGLHPRDTQRLITSLKKLRDLGNTIILVEHDRETMEAADHIIDMGPGAGARGGRVVASGNIEHIIASDASLTGRYLRGDARVAEPAAPIEFDRGELRLRGVRCHNLQDLDVDIPLGCLTAVAGVSGSGKSTLVMDVLARAANLGTLEIADLETIREIEGLDQIRRCVRVDQRAIGRTPKSTPATYTGLWTPMRELYARLPLSKVKGYSPGRFSFNSPEGRCAACDGQGSRLIEMHFLSDIWVECEVCRGKRFDESTLDVLFKGHSIFDVLKMTVDEAAEVFDNQPKIVRILRILHDVGLGYIQLGQSSSTLSGGEAQRVKLASELVDPKSEGNLYILDEPTTGLHFDDIRKLLSIFQRLVDQGNSVIVIEHHLDVIAAADWVIEMGPDAGDDGGQIVAQGRPGNIATLSTATGICLREHLNSTANIG